MKEKPQNRAAISSAPPPAPARSPRSASSNRIAQTEPPGTISSEMVKQEKAKAMQWHSERPLTGSLPAHEHDFDVTPSDRMFIRNNLLTPGDRHQPAHADHQGAGGQGGDASRCSTWRRTSAP